MKKVALINDLSGFGRSSLVAAIPVISVMGVQACPLPTAILSAQSEFEHYFCEDFTDKMDVFTEQWKLMGESFDGIYSGYLASSVQIDKVLHFLEVFGGKDVFYLADPVMGDHGQTYDMYTGAFLEGMKRLTVEASVITPNLTELCLLADEDYEKLVSNRQSPDYLTKIKEICERVLAKAKREQTIIVTGILQHKEEGEFIGTLVLSSQGMHYTEAPYTGSSFCGTGDLFASVVCGAMIKGLSAAEAMEKAVNFLQPAIEEATLRQTHRNHGVPFEKYLPLLLQQDGIE